MVREEAEIGREENNNWPAGAGPVAHLKAAQGPISRLAGVRARSCVRASEAIFSERRETDRPITSPSESSAGIRPFTLDQPTGSIPPLLTGAESRKTLAFISDEQYEKRRRATRRA